MSTGETKRQAARATVAMLCQRWPKCFDLKNRRPLKIGIAHDLVRELGDAVSRPELKGALNMYCGHLVYLSTLRAGTSRLDLQGKEVGIVSRDDELRAAARLKAAKTARTKARTRVTEENLPHQTITPPLSIFPETEATSARLGFEALRKAARERKARGQVRDENKQENEI
jgi:ProP effector